MPLQPLPDDLLARVRDLHAELGAGDDVTTTRWAEIAALQPQFAQALNVAGSGPQNAFESFALIRDRPDYPPLVGPRWWFHLLGLRHGSAHVVLTTPQGWFVAQRRSRDKDDAPGALDVAVSGHIGTADPETGAWRELAEEVGLIQMPDGEEPNLAGNRLAFFTSYDVVDAAHVQENPPVLNRERLWVYHARLTPTGMARLRFADGEVTSLMLMGPEDVSRMAQRCRDGATHVPGELDLAMGIRNTLPRWVDAQIGD
jgi:hypothetical protein